MATDSSSSLSPNKQALLKIRQLKQQLAAANRLPADGYEPLAIVSMACRFPQRAYTPEQFWECLLKQTDQVSEIPADRWDLAAFYDQDPDVPGRMYARHGCFLDQIDQMDPEFFGISPREATWIDPQQRLLLEVTWEALERAGWVPGALAGSTGVFVGWMHNDYQNEASDSFWNLNPYIATGAAGSFLPGRLAHVFGFNGPSLAVDTACSSSLVALHQACQSLQRRDCDQAIVGGVNVICSPTTNILTCKLKALSPSGHSRAFDAAADGYLRGEGCGVIALRRLADAEADGDPILGVVRGSAVGHNGSGGGLTVPNPHAQARVIREALQRAQIAPDQVAYLEAHGTGTELGDPIELQAAAAALGADRQPHDPLLVGSVKTNIGHLEAAAGMAGLIKVLLALQHGTIPGQLHFDQPNPHIPWDRLPVKILTEATSWPVADRRIAGVSAFGMSGTNAHVVIEAGPAAAASSAPAAPRTTTSAASPIRSATGPNLIVLSGKNERAVAELADRYGDYLTAENSPALADIAYTTGVGRTHFPFRAAVVADDRDAAAESLRTIARGGTADAAYVGNGKPASKIVWQFTGQGSQYVGMCRQLYQREPVFAAAIDQCDRLLQDIGRDESLIDVLFEHPDRIDHTSWTQPGLFAIQRGLAQWLTSIGLQPDVVFGHSVGQYAAACVAGMMSWDEGLRLIAERGRLIGQLPQQGRMLAVFLPAAQMTAELEGYDGVSLAALNGTHTVVSGDSDQVDALARRLEARGIRCQPLNTSHAFHSELMEPVLKPFRQFADRVAFNPPQIPLICNVTGQPVAPHVRLDGRYWADHIRQPVRYAESVESARQLGCDVLLELGPQAVLTRMAAASWGQSPDRLICVLDRETDDLTALRRALARLYVCGVTPDFQSLYQEQPVRQVTLPTYPFQRRRFWGPAKPDALHADAHTAHPLLGGELPLAAAEQEVRFESHLAPDRPGWVADHRVLDTVVLPGAAYLEMAMAAADGRMISDVQFEQPLRLDRRTRIQTLIRDTGQGAKSIEIYSVADHGHDCKRHFTAQLRDRQEPDPAVIDRQAIADRCDQEITAADFYARLQEIGLQYGPGFQTIQSLRYREDQLLALLSYDGDVRGYQIAPNLLDGAIHALAIGLQPFNGDQLFLPVGAKSVTCFRPATPSFWCHAQWVAGDASERSADLLLFDDSGQPIAEVRGLAVRAVSRTALRQLSGAGPQRLIHSLHWKALRLPAATVDPQTWLIIHGARHRTAAAQLAAGFDSQGHSSIQVDISADQLSRVDPHHVRLNGSSSDQWQQLLAAVNESESSSGFEGIVWLLEPSPANDLPHDPCAEAEHSLTSLLCLVQALLERGDRKLGCGLAMVTTEAVASDQHPRCQPGQSLYWGFGRVLSAEQPGLRCRLIDMPDSWADEGSSLGQLIALLLTDTADNQFMIRDQQYLVPRLQSQRLPRSSGLPLAVDPQGAVLITGGLGALGLRAAEWLVDRGATQLVLVSRRGPDEAARQWIESLEQRDCEVIVAAADCSLPDDIRELVNRFGVDWKPLVGVVHAAGVVDDGLVDTQSWPRFRSVLGAKVTGAQTLHECTQTLSLDFFMLYSSAAAILGSPGQSNYAAANAYLDSLAWQRRSQGLPAISLNWGPWAAGMADDERLRKRLTLQGITPLVADEAHQVIEQMRSASLTQATVMDVDWRRMRTGMGGQLPALLADLLPARQQTAATESALVAKLKQTSGSEQRSLLLENIQAALQRILSTTELPEIDRPLIEMGLDSLMAVEFGTELSQLLGDDFAIGPTLLFDHPTIAAIGDYVLDLLSGKPADSEPVPAAVGPPSLPRGAALREPVAVIGMSCQFPGADDIEQFWSNLINGVDSVGEIPGDRWDIERFYSADREPGKMYTRQGGFLERIGDFDAHFFNISDVEACWIDPQHRLLLENTYHALEDAGICSAPLADPQVGVFMGIMGQDYAFLPQLEDQHIVNAFQGAGLSHSAGVGRISYVFGFEGPSVAVDTASSSSLVAVLQAVRSLQDHHCKLAVAGGVNAILAPVNSLLMCKAGLLSADGRCKSFSAAADGFGRGEGCGVIVLKRLSDAQQAGDRILAVIRGGAVVHNGFSSGITSPSGKAQSRVIRAALEDAGIAPSQVQYLEAHGTGTEFGDPLEIGAAAAVYGKGRQQDDRLLVGSVKSNISHLEAAGGISGLIKTILSIDRGRIPPQIHFEEPNPHIPWSRLPLQIVTEPTTWPAGAERIAGVTALGLVGTNAHVVVSSPPPAGEATAESAELPPPAVADRPVHVLFMSARDASALQRLVENYREFIDRRRELDLAAICRTAAAGRRHFEHRLAVTVESHQDAVDKLTGWLEMTTASTSRDGTGGAGSNGRPSRRGGRAERFAAAGDGIAIGTATELPKLGWVFTGDASSTLDAARRLYQAEPLIRELTAQLDRRLAEHCGSQADSVPSLEHAFGHQPGENGHPIVPADVQLFAFQAGLAQLWRSWGIEPDLVLGAGVGQYTAACVAGVMDFADAIVLVLERHRWLASGQLTRSPQADNGPRETAEAALAKFESIADGFNYYPPNLPLICSLSGQTVPIHRALGGSYWKQLLTSEAAIEDSLHCLVASDCDYLLQLGPDGRTGDLRGRDWDFETLEKALLSMPAAEDPLRAMPEMLGRLYVAGVHPNYPQFDRNAARTTVSLPGYPFQKQRYWITEVDQFLNSNLESAEVSGRS